MSDKLRAGVSVTPTFVSGETPPANKLNAISVQMRYAAQQLEKAVGDIHGQSYPYSTNLTTLSRPYPRDRFTGNKLTGSAEKWLDIANIARLIGPASNLNPRAMAQQTITEAVPVGVHQFQLRYVPDDRTAVTFTDATVFAVYFSSGSGVSAAGDYHVSQDGKVHTVSATAGGTVTYTTTPRLQGGEYSHPSHRANVIPDPHQIEAGGPGISWGSLTADGTRTGTLPTATHGLSNYEGDSTTLSADDLIFGQQYFMPAVLVDNFTAGEEIPAGFLFVKNETTGEVYEDAEYFYDTNTTFIMGGTDITDDINAGHLFSVITVGTDITSSIDDLRVKTRHHVHDRAFGEPFIPSRALLTLEEAGNKGSFVPSSIGGNFAPQYLHRDGWTPGVDDTHNDGNALRGNLMIGLKNGSAGSYVAATGESYKLMFSSSSGSQACYLYRDTNNDFRIRNAGGAGGERNIYFEGDGTTGGGGAVVFENGYKGTRGGISNRVHVLVVSGFTTDISAATENLYDLTTDLATNPFTGTEQILGFSMVLEADTLLDDKWFPPGYTGPGPYEYSAKFDGYQLVYHAESMSGSGVRRWRAVVWYAE